MTINDAQKLKDELEKKILDLINDFESKTNLNVEDIALKRLLYIDKEAICNVDVVVNL